MPAEPSPDRPERDRSPTAAGHDGDPGLEPLLLTLVGIGIGIAVVELAMWSLYDVPWYDQLTAAQELTGPKDYRQNNFGLRDDDYLPPQPADHRRVMVLGDSFTFGLGVMEDRSVFPELLEDHLNERLDEPGVERFDVLNAGIPGSLTDKWLYKWEVVGPQFDPDAVLIVFFLRDGTRTHSIPDFFGAIHEEVTTRNRRSWLYQSSYTWRRIRDNLDRRDVGERYTRAFQNSYFGSEEEQAEWREAQRNVLAIRDGARALGARVGFVIFPVLVELNESYPFVALCELLEGFALENDMPVLNLLPHYMGMDSPSLWVSSFDQHPNARGHAIAAEALYPFTAELLSETQLQ